MKAGLRCALALLCLILITACRQGSMPSAGGGSPAVSQRTGSAAIPQRAESPSAPQPDPLTEEASGAAKKYWSKQLRLCDEHDGSYVDLFFLYRGVTFDIEPLPVAEVDQMNHIEWRGRTTFHAKYTRNIGGGDWVPFTEGLLTNSGRIERRSGKWFGSAGVGEFGEMKPVESLVTVAPPCPAK